MPPGRFDSGRSDFPADGRAEFTFGKPPPLVPSCLIATCDAAGPTAITCSLAVLVSVTGLPEVSVSGVPSASSLGCS